MVRVLVPLTSQSSPTFLGVYRQRPTVSGVIASLLWLVSLGLTLAWLAMLDDDALTF